MKRSISYENCFIRGQSFQREKNGLWIRQCNLPRHETGNKGAGFRSQQYQLNDVFRTEKEADDFVLEQQRSGLIKTESRSAHHLSLCIDI
jgi:hypothetical protein